MPNLKLWLTGSLAQPKTRAIKRAAWKRVGWGERALHLLRTRPLWQDVQPLQMEASAAGGFPEIVKE